MPVASANYCTYIMMSLSVCFAISGLVCSWRASKTCYFISFKDSDGDAPDFAEDPPFNRALAANVGIFRYEITSLVNGGSPTGCIPYDERFGQQQGYPSIATAQFCSVIGPCFAILGTFFVLLEFCVCNFPGSFVIACTSLLVATGVQAGTFTLVADPVFCFEDSELECTQGKGVYLSSAAVVMFFIASCLCCCAPRADPFCFNFGLEHKPATKKVQTNPGHTVVLQPVIIQSPAPAGSEDDWVVSPKKKKKSKNGKAKKSKEFKGDD